jgi:RNA polymerase sigma-70 factor (ECF subfamily)
VSEIKGVSDPVERAFRRHYGEVYRFIRRRTGEHERAEDIAQEVFAAAAAALPDFSDDAESPLAWLYTVAKRRFADEARRRSREPTVRPPDEGTLEYGPNVASSVRAAMSRLPEDQQRVLALKLLRGASFAEIAGRQGVSEAAAKMRFVRAMRALRGELQKEGIEP